MRRFIPLLIFAGILLSSQSLYSQQDQEVVECLVKAKSCIPLGTTPQPFQELKPDGEGDLKIRWDHDEPAISTGYYFVTNSSIADEFWRPRSSDYLSEEDEIDKWITIEPGPRVRDEDFWDSEENEEGGYWFFRNPGTNNGDMFDPNPGAAIDSTDDAIAGPMRLGISGGFRFNGIRYDSFYVSTNGLIALTNRRYLYGQDGNRVASSPRGDAYDSESMDWYERSRSGNGMNDPTPDDYGWRYVALGNNPNNQYAGIRARGGRLNNVSNPYKAAVIAPFYGDLHLSQYSANQGEIDPHGLVFYRRSTDGRSLYITFKNIAPKEGDGGNGTAITKNGCGRPINSQITNGDRVTADLRPGDENYLSATAQVILNGRDSSVTIIYRTFLGAANFGNCTTPANEVFRYNTTAGVSGFARHINFNRAAAFEDPTVEYEQYTHHWIEDSPIDARRNLPWPRPQYAVRYKTWQNTLRVADIQYRVRDPLITPVPDLSFSQRVKSSEVNNYELLAGEARLGAIQPVAIIQNLSNDIQGSQKENFVRQDLEFRARFSIRNQASGRTVFQKLTIVDSLCMATSDDDLLGCSGDPNVKIRLSEMFLDGDDYEPTEYTPTVDDPNAEFQFPGDGTGVPSGKPLNGVPPYGFVKINFPPFEPSEFVDDHIGRLEAAVIAVPQTVIGDPIGDEWPFDDTTRVNLFVLKRLNSFYDDGSEFHLIDGVPMPSVWKWVNIDAEMVSGEQVSKHPLPPRQEYSAQFVDAPASKAWLPDKIAQARAFTLRSPVISMNRLTLGGGEPAESPGGDIIRSFPVDMRGRENSVLSISIQRVRYRDDWERGYGDATLVGPEPRAIFNGNVLGPYQVGTAASANPDEIVVELANNSVGGPDKAQERLFHVTNIDDERWRFHFRDEDNDELIEKDVPALGLYGGGGYRVGFLENDPDSVLAEETQTRRNSLRPNVYDDGFDEEYRKFFIAIPDTFINFPNEVAQNFRFRVRVMATNDLKCIICIPDDSDDFYVDNVKILFEDVEATDIEVSAVKVKWPYTRVPASQATKVPIQVRVTNNTTGDAPTYFIKLKIFRGSGNNVEDEPIYCRTEPVPTHRGRQTVDYDMPTFNAREVGPGDYRLQAIVLLPGDTDKDPRNDTTYFDWNIEFGEDFAYDPITDDPENDVSQELGKPVGRGLNLFGSAFGGTVFGGYDFVQNAAGATGGNGSGQIAMKFDLQNTDTLYGYRAYFAVLNQARDDISFHLFEGNENTPGNEIAQASIFRRRGESDVEVDGNGNPLVSFGEYVDFRLDGGEGVILQPGTYWVGIAQRGETGLELGASGVRGGMRTLNISQIPNNPIGSAGIQLAIHKEFRKKGPNGDQLNDNLFAYENTLGSRQWEQFMLTEGIPAYAHLHHWGLSPTDGITRTLSRGFWIPMVRPYFGIKSYSEDAPYIICPDEIPVELAYFRGNAVSNGLEIYWETKSEENSRGFFIERKLHSQDSEDAWTKLPTFIEGRGKGYFAGSTQYSHIDSDIKPNVLYDYRLRQVDIDGTHDCESSGIVTLEWTPGAGDLMVSQKAYPNPFTESTVFQIYNPEPDFVTVEILDMYGNVVTTLLNERVDQGEISLDWDGRSQTGNKVSQGTYLYRVTTSNGVISDRVNYVVK